MQRVLIITAGLMGLWLILGVGGLAIVRAREEAPPTMLVDAPDDIRPDKRAIYIAGFGSRLHRKLIAGYLGYIGRGWSPDGEWFYLVGTSYPSPNVTGDGDVWRISQNGHHVEQLSGMHYPWRAAWTPDGTWLLYGDGNEAEGNRGLYRVRPDGSVVENLTADFNQAVTAGCEIVTDGEWVYFCSEAENWEDYTDLFRLHIGDEQVENLTAIVKDPPSLVAQAENGAWSIIRTQSQVYMTGPNGSNPMPVFEEWLPDGTIHPITWIPSVGILLVRTSSGAIPSTTAFEMPSGRFLWQHTGRYVAAVIRDDWLIMQFGVEAIFRMRPDGTDLTQIVGGDDIKYYFAVTPDGQWLVYMSLDTDADTIDLWRVPLMGGEPNHLFHVNSLETSIEFVSWSLDRQWLLFQYGPDDMDTIMVKMDGSERRPLVEWGDARFLDWFGPIDRDWHPFGLMGVGAVLIGVYGLVTLKKKSA